MGKKIFVIKAIGESEVKGLFPIAPKDTSFLEYETKHIYKNGDYIAMRELTSTFKGWAFPFKKAMFSEDIGFIETHINIGTLTNQIIECVYLDSSLKESKLAAKVVEATGKVTFEVDLPLSSLPSDGSHFYIGFKVTENYSGDRMVLGYTDSTSSAYIDYNAQVSDIAELYTTDRTNWVTSEGGYKHCDVAFYSKVFKEIVYKDAIPSSEKVQSKNLFDVNFAETTRGYWWNSGKPEANQYTTIYRYTNKIDVSDCEKIYIQNFANITVRISRHEFMDATGNVIEGESHTDWLTNNQVYYELEVPAGASTLVVTLVPGDEVNILKYVTISSELMSEYGAYYSGFKYPNLYVEQANVLGQEIVVDLPEEYNLVTYEAFELFFEGVIKAKEPLNYNIEVECAIGKAHRRKFKASPLTEGEYPLTLKVYDDYGKLVGSGETKLVVKAARTSPSENINVLCIGDSLTEGGVWVDEFYRRLVKTNSVTQSNAEAPTGKGLSNITFVGKKTTANGAGYEGIGGWNYRKYLDSTKDNPFEYDGAVDFTAYCEELNIDKIDVAYILLGWNSVTENEETYKANLTEFVGHLMDHNPNCKVVFIGLQMPCLDGLGENYGATGAYSKYRELQQFVINHNKWNKERAEFFSGDFVQLSGQFDSRYNCQLKEEQVNTRNTSKEQIGANGVHPATNGYYQIADAAYRHFNNMAFSEEELTDSEIIEALEGEY